MKRFGAVVRIVAAVALAQLGWTWLERHDGDMRMRRLLAGRGVAAGTVAPDDGALRIESFYAREAEIVEGERNLVCYGVRNAKSLRLEPRVEELSPAAVVRCFWIAPRESTTYRLTAEGFDGKVREASFTVQVRPAPPEFRMVAVSEKAIPPGEVVTVCYSVEHATAVRLDPAGWKLPVGAKNCIRFYPKQTMEYTLVASGAGERREKFRVAVGAP